MTTSSREALAEYDSQYHKVLTDVFSAQFSALNVALSRLESLKDLDKSGSLLCLVKVGFPFDRCSALPCPSRSSVIRPTHTTLARPETLFHSI
jgi:hypothetical protein